MRARNIKPAFFANDELAELPALTRLLFIALWCQADREGRLEDRPKRIRALALPYDDIDTDAALDELAEAGFIQRYEAEGDRFIQVTTFSKHQHPHVKEADSVIPEPPPEKPTDGPAPDQHRASTRPAPCKPEKSPSDCGLLITDSIKDRSARADRFPDFWKVYPKKRKRKQALEIWKRKRLDRSADELIADVEKRKTADRRWLDGFAPDPTTYLNGERWTDELEQPKAGNGNGATALPRNRDDLPSWAAKHGLRGPKVGESWDQYKAFLQGEATQMDVRAEGNKP